MCSMHAAEPLHTFQAHQPSPPRLPRFTCDDIALFDPIDHREPLYPGITAAPVPAAVGDDGLPYTGGVAALYKEGAMEGPAAT